MNNTYQKIKDRLNIDLSLIRRYIDISIVNFQNEYDNAYNDFIAEYDLMYEDTPGTIVNQLNADPDLRFFGGISPQLLKRTSLIALFGMFETLLI